MPGTAVDIDGFSQWGRQQLLLRDKKTRQENIALRLAWEPEARPQYTLNLPSPENRSWTLSDAQALTFGLVSADVEPRPLTVSVELESATGQVVRLPLSQFGAIHPPLPARILKADWVKAVLGFDKIDVQTPYERVLQTYVLPLNAFEATDPAFQADQLTVIRFLFDGPEGGALYLDEIGFLNN
jgi:hypothetical protein